MKALKLIFVAIFTLLCITETSAQRGHGSGHGRGNGGGKHNAGYRRSPYRPQKVIVYHPYWHPNYAYNRRWVFFPKYNIYWDNWRNHYVYYNGVIWISQPTPPPVIVNVNLDKEKSTELKEKDDDVDDVYKDNNTHKQEIKPE